MRVFDFGANWQAFTEQRVDEQRLTIAQHSLQQLLGNDRLTGKTVLDVGCGSGLFSVAAARLGAKQVLGVDINPRCIEVSAANLARFAPGSAVRFQQMSALDSAGMASLGTFDAVYAWGSLHHTGAMWDAIRNTMPRVVPGGVFVIAIYNQHSTSAAWHWIKRTYNQMPTLIQQLMAIFFAGVIFFAKMAVTRRNPLEKERGMDFWYDVIDWIGGYPYEYATPQLVTAFVQAHGFRLRRMIPAQVPTGCNEFVFEKLGK
jgi:2-polyprenyl-6-hydroxyphenyl methylase/3-demethylubiquinone-9 3-methyltransferase